ncbi:hypothetical protein C9890_0528, partial [Perkinsus sp. BL_2016]
GCRQRRDRVPAGLLQKDCQRGPGGRGSAAQPRAAAGQPVQRPAAGQGGVPQLPQGHGRAAHGQERGPAGHGGQGEGAQGGRQGQPGGHLQLPLQLWRV